MHGKIKRDFIHCFFISFITAVFSYSKTIFNISLALCNNFCHTHVLQRQGSSFSTLKAGPNSWCGHEIFFSPDWPWLWGLSSFFSNMCQSLFPQSDWKPVTDGSIHLHCTVIRHRENFFCMSVLLMYHSLENACHWLNKIVRMWSVPDYVVLTSVICTLAL